MNLISFQYGCFSVDFSSPSKFKFPKIFLASGTLKYNFLKTATFISEVIAKMKTTLLKMRIILWVCYASFLCLFLAVADDYVISDAQCISVLKKNMVHQGRCGGKTMYNNFLTKVQNNIFAKKLHILKENFQAAGVSIIFLDIYFPGYKGFN